MCCTHLLHICTLTCCITNIFSPCILNGCYQSGWPIWDTIVVPANPNCQYSTTCEWDSSILQNHIHIYYLSITIHCPSLWLYCCLYDTISISVLALPLIFFIIFLIFFTIIIVYCCIELSFSHFSESDSNHLMISSIKYLTCVHTTICHKIKTNDKWNK